MKVLLFSPLALENGRGGEISLIELAAGLSKFFNITLIDTNRIMGEKLLSKEVIIQKLSGVKSIKHLRFTTSRFLNRTFSFPFPLEFLKLAREIKMNNIIYSSLGTVKINLMLMFSYLVNRKAKFVIGFRRPLYSEKKISFYNLKYRFSIILLSLFKKRLHFHTISFHAKKFLENFYNPNRITHIIHGVELSNFVSKSIDYTGKKSLHFIYVGHLDDTHKGVGVLLKAIEELLVEKKNIKIVFEFCGAGPLEPRLINLQKRFPEFILYNGYISNDQIADFYKKNDIFLFTSRREPLGRVIIEALASKLVIICTLTYGSIEILKKQDFAFFIHNLTPQAIKEKILEVYNLWDTDQIKIEDLQESAKNYALQNYSLIIELEKFKILFNKICNNC